MQIWADRWPDIFEYGVIGVDPSKGNTEAGDYFAAVFVGSAGEKLWIDAVLDRAKHVSHIVGEVVRFCYDGRHPTDAVGLEANAFQDLLAPEFDRQCALLGVPPLPVHLMHNSCNKALRIARLGPYLDRDKLRFRDTPGTRLLVEQLQEFPLAEHDDGPDAVEFALRLLRHITSKFGEADAIATEDLCEL
jgi:predicted phage terminase large subunit-like protein